MAFSTIGTSSKADRCLSIVVTDGLVVSFWCFRAYLGLLTYVLADITWTSLCNAVLEWHILCCNTRIANIPQNVNSDTLWSNFNIWPGRALFWPIQNFHKMGRPHLDLSIYLVLTKYKCSTTPTSSYTDRHLSTVVTDKIVVSFYLRMRTRWTIQRLVQKRTEE